MAACSRSVGLRPLEAFAFRVVFQVDRYQCRHTEATQVLLAHFCTGAFGRHHDDREIVTDFHAFFDDIETVRIGEAGALLHERHDGFHHVGVLFVRREVKYQVSFRDHLFVGADLKTGLGGFNPRRSLFFDRFFAERVGHVQPAIPQIQALIEALSTTTDDHQLLSREWRDTCLEFSRIHEAALTQLLKLGAEGEGVEIIAHG